MSTDFIDIHCHLLPGIDDGADDLRESLAMARMAVADGTTTIIVTPHQLGNFTNNTGDDILSRTSELQDALKENGIPLKVLPGADVRIDDGMVESLVRGDVLSLGDHRRHVLLELPHELYLSLEPVLDQLARQRMTGILSHPERNLGILRQPNVLRPLVEAGCLMQITAGSLSGSFGPGPQQMAEFMICEGLVHFVATDAHGVRSRRPLMRRAFDRVRELTNEETALDLCCRNPACVASGRDIRAGQRPATARARTGWGRRTAA